jgi:hypothetical protein
MHGCRSGYLHLIPCEVIDGILRTILRALLVLRSGRMQYTSQSQQLFRDQHSCATLVLLLVHAGEENPNKAVSCAEITAYSKVGKES